MLQFAPLGNDGWKMTGPKGTLDIPVKSSMILNSLLMIKAMAVIGEGVSLLPTYYWNVEVKAGKLVKVLPEWRSPLTPCILCIRRRSL